jgi:hypothetical protein
LICRCFFEGRSIMADAGTADAASTPTKTVSAPSTPVSAASVSTPQRRIDRYGFVVEKYGDVLCELRTASHTSDR